MSTKKRFTKWYVKRGYKFGYDSSHVAIWHCPWLVKPLLCFFSPSVYCAENFGKLYADAFMEGLKKGMGAKEDVNIK